MAVMVIIINELADLMLAEKCKEIENLICRIAQKGRAAGIHLVVSTQRPAGNILTGNIRANFPTRLAFQVRNEKDRRVILDQPGAETLLGRRDMFYMAPMKSKSERVQGTYVSDETLHAVVDFVSQQTSPQIDNQLTVETEFEISEEDNQEPEPEKYLQPDDSPLVRAALALILNTQSTSTSYMQRRLFIGYNQACELLELFEKRGVVRQNSDGKWEFIR